MIDDNIIEEYYKMLDRQRLVTETEKMEIINYSMGLSGEAGEVLEMIKKWVFQGHSLDATKLENELGDTLFYLLSLGKIFGVELEEIIKVNMEKINKRYPNGFTKEDSVKRIDIKK